MTAISIVLSILIVLGGGAVVAENTVPGDALYEYKVAVSEPFRSALTFGSRSKTQWSAKQAERRLEEAAKLAAQGEFNEDSKATLESRFEAHATKTRDRIEALLEKGNAEAAVEASNEFEASLGAHERILARLGNRNQAMNQLKITVGDERRAAAKLRSSAEAEIRTEAENSEEIKEELGLKAAALLEKTEAKIEQAREDTAGIRAEIKAEVNAKINNATAMVQRASANLEAKAVSEAYLGLQQAMRALEEVAILIQSDNKNEEDTEDEAEEEDLEEKIEEKTDNQTGQPAAGTENGAGAAIKIQSEAGAGVNSGAAGTQGNASGGLGIDAKIDGGANIRY